jgi:hypothetical protein
MQQPTDISCKHGPEVKFPEIGGPDIRGNLHVGLAVVKDSHAAGERIRGFHVDSCGHGGVVGAVKGVDYGEQVVRIRGHHTDINARWNNE